MIKHRIYSLFSVFFLIFFLSACGQKGSLYQPEAEVESETTTQTITNTETEQQSAIETTDNQQN